MEALGAVRRSSVPDEVFGRLCDAILAGRYAPGERLPPQRALAAELEVNMASVREALKRLEQLRLVEVRHGDATRVLDWRRSGGLEALALVGSVDATVLGPLFEARRLLLAESARLAASRRSVAQAEALVAAAAEFAAAPDARSRQLADWTFMAAVVEAAGNLVFQLIMNSVRELYVAHADRFAAIVARPDELAPLYRAAAAAIADAEPDAAAAAVAALAAAQEARMAEADAS
ncbi:MAG: FadR family transcriptional regulator [Solirubrobacterales bacterium]|nr:FadR family transcriptional regulator [Solirubrobacterales bacterium]